GVEEEGLTREAGGAGHLDLLDGNAIPDSGRQPARQLGAGLLQVPLNRDGQLRRVPGRQVHRLELEVLLQAFGAELAADARLLEPAEGGGEGEDEAVHRVGAGAHLPGDFDATGRIGGPDGARQPVVRVVGDAYGVGFRLVRDDGDDGPEDLLLGDAHLVVDVDED